MRTNNGFLDGSHLSAVIRLALRARGFAVSYAEVDQALDERFQLGCRLRDHTLPQRFPPFVAVADYDRIAEVDPGFWDRLPRMLGFGYQQAVVLQGYMARSPEGDGDVATLGAAFSAGIALVDYLVDTQTDGARVFDILNRDIVRGMFEPTGNAIAALAAKYEGAADPRRRLLLALVATCAAGFRELYHRSSNEMAWAALAQTVSRMYEAERTVSLVEPTSRTALREMLPMIEAKSVLPFVAMQQMVFLAAPPSDLAKRAEQASTTLGRIIALTDDLVDLLDDCHRGVPNAVMLRLADRLAERGRSWPSDADVYDVVDDTVGDLIELLQPSTFGMRISGPSMNPDIAAFNGGDRANARLDAVVDFAQVTVAAWVGWQEEHTAVIPSEVWDRGIRIAPSNPTRAATAMLLNQQRDGYREAIHPLLLPRLSPEGIRLERHPALLFQRAIVLDSLLDAHAAGHAVPHAVRAAEALAILRAKHRHVPGGWNYIPEVPELPPDADDLGMVLQVLYRTGGAALASTCDRAIQLALAAAAPNGGFPTWVLDPNGRSTLDHAMHAYIEVTDSGGVHPDVVANLLYGLLLYNPDRYRAALRHAVAYFASAQDERGAWRSRWYAGPYYGTYRVVSVLNCLVPEHDVVRRARTFLLQSQRLDGSWGEGGSDALATALAIMALTTMGMRPEDTIIERGVTYLIDTQEIDGGWPAHPFICFPTSDGATMHTYASRTITTAFCLKALLSAVSTRDTAPDCTSVLARAADPSKPVSGDGEGGGWS